VTVAIIEIGDVSKTVTRELVNGSPKGKLSEPDLIPSETAVIKVRMYSRLLYRELKGSGR